MQRFIVLLFGADSRVESLVTNFLVQWKELPIDKAPDGKVEIHYTVIYKLFARWADDGSLKKAFIASVKHLADENKLDLSLLHGDGSNTVAKKGATGLATMATNIRRGKR